MQPKTVTILGSTGSIGQSSVNLLKLHRERFQVIALTAYNNPEKLAQQAKILGCKKAVIGNEALYKDLKAALSGSNIEVAAGEKAICEAAAIPSDIVVAAIVGAAGLLPTLTAISRGAVIALANKECLVCAGDMVMQQAKQHHATIIPVDSEHSAIFQVFDFAQVQAVEKITLTASGGPFRGLTKAQLQNVTREQALKHPNWSMGAKITIDSATMMNKGLEMIEAFHLFPVNADQIEVIIHPESIIHSMVSYKDGSVLAQMGTPDMSTPIAYALAYPQRMESLAKKLDLVGIGKLQFYAPDEVLFPALALSKAALRTGGNAPLVMNAANEVAVAKFLAGEIAFQDIIKVVSGVLDAIPFAPITSIEEVLIADANARNVANGSPTQ